ncbi:hypothetical protein BH23DEI1_BH23DEI1_04720 [soil metagenome]|nr:hypothetical protein [Trueperaceae bacterium]
MMNRQIRRAQEKQDKKAEKEKERKRDARREKIQTARARRLRGREAAKARRAAGGSAASDDGANDATKGGAPAATGRPGKKPGRFAGALMMATIFFIVLQSAAPSEDVAGNELLRTVTGAGFYLLFGYFSVLWLMRRNTPRAVMMTLISGAFLTIGVEVAKMFQTDVTTDPLMLALAIPGLVAGAFLGRLVYTNSPG